MRENKKEIKVKLTAVYNKSEVQLMCLLKMKMVKLKRY
jgi:hypothetical protein